VTRASRELRQIPGVRNFGSHIGQALLGEETVGVNFGENWVSIDPKADYAKTVERLENTAAGYPGLFRDVQTYLVERTHEVLSGSTNAITVRIFGPNLGMLRQKADEINHILGGIPGVVDNHVDLQEDVPQIQVRVDVPAARKYGLKPGDIRRATSYLVAGEEAGDIFHAGKAYDVNVQILPEKLRNVSDIQNLMIDTPDGSQVPLKTVADVAVEPTPNGIHHENLSRNIDVGANVRGSDLGSVVNELNRRMQNVRMPQEFHAELLGEYQERQTASKRLYAFAIAAAIAIFLLLQASFASWRLAMFSFLTLPVALVGGVLAVGLTSKILSLGALVGLFTVLGVVARWTIMLISHYQHLEQFEGEPFGPGLVIRGALERLVPITMTVLAAGLALVPLVLTGERPGQEIEHPMAVVILGGLFTATLLNLFVVPPLYLRFAKGWRRTRGGGPDAPAAVLPGNPA
jgi:Cu/Ag efflux pump CusA